MPGIDASSHEMNGFPLVDVLFITREDLEWLLVRQPANCLWEQAMKWIKEGRRGEIGLRKPQTSPFFKKEVPAIPVTTALPEVSGITSEMHLFLYWDLLGSTLKAFPGDSSSNAVWEIDGNEKDQLTQFLSTEQILGPVFLLSSPSQVIENKCKV